MLFGDGSREEEGRRDGFLVEKRLSDRLFKLIDFSVPNLNPESISAVSGLVVGASRVRGRRGKDS